MERLRLPMSALAILTRKSLTANLMKKIRSGILCYHVDADIRSQKSLHTLFDKYFDHMLVKFEQNRMVRTTQNFELFDTKMVNHS